MEDIDMWKSFISRRNALAGGIAMLGGTFLGKVNSSLASPVRSRPYSWGGSGAAGADPNHDPDPLAPGEPGRDYTPTLTPN